MKRLGRAPAVPNFLYTNQEVSILLPLFVRSFSVTHFFPIQIKRLLRTLDVMDEVFQSAYKGYYVKFKTSMFSRGYVLELVVLRIKYIMLNSTAGGTKRLTTPQRGFIITAGGFAKLLKSLEKFFSSFGIFSVDSSRV